MNEASLQEGELEWMGKSLHDWSETNVIDLGEQTLDDIDHSDWAELADIRGPHYFGDQGNNAKVQAGHHQSPREELLEQLHDHRLKLVPKSLEETHGQPI